MASWYYKKKFALALSIAPILMLSLLIDVNTGVQVLANFQTIDNWSQPQILRLRTNTMLTLCKRWLSSKSNTKCYKLNKLVLQVQANVLKEMK